MSPLRRIIVDASAVVAALVDASADGQWVRAQLVGCAFDAPVLMHYEAANYLRRGVISKALSDLDASDAYAQLWQWPVTTWGLERFAGRVWDLRQNVTAYDAAYVALAEYLDVPLLTLDTRLTRAPGTRCAFIALGG